MELAQIAEAGGLTRLPEAPMVVDGCDPVLAARHRIGEAAAAALAFGGGAARIRAPRSVRGSSATC